MIFIISYLLFICSTQPSMMGSYATLHITYNLYFTKKSMHIFVLAASRIAASCSCTTSTAPIVAGTVAAVVVGAATIAGKHMAHYHNVNNNIWLISIILTWCSHPHPGKESWS